MFGIGLPEFLLILVVGIIFINPKDIPHALHTMGKYFRKFKSIARGVQESIDDVMDAAELEEITLEANKAKNIKIDDEEAIKFHNQLLDLEENNEKVNVENKKRASNV